MALIEGTQGQQTGVAGDLATGTIGANGLMAVAGEGQLWSTGCHLADAPKRWAGFCENPAFMHLLARISHRRRQEVKGGEKKWVVKGRSFQA